MKICYIPPKGKKKEIRLYSSLISSLLMFAVTSPELALVSSALVVAICYYTYNECNIRNVRRRKEEEDAQIKAYDREKKLEKMNPSPSKSVNTKYLL